MVLNRDISAKKVPMYKEPHLQRKSDQCAYLWKKGTTESMDKDLFRKDEGDIIEAYSFILESLKKDVK